MICVLIFGNNTRHCSCFVATFVCAFLLLQLVNMFVQEDWSVYVTEFQDTHGQKKYPNVTPKMVYNLLYK